MNLFGSLVPTLFRALGSRTAPAPSDVPFTRDFRETSRLLEEWRVGEFSGLIPIIQTHLGSEHPVAKDGGVRVRPVPLLRRLSRDAAPQYILRPRRAWEGLSAVQEEALRGRYKSLRVDAVLRLAQQQIVAQNSVIVALVPSLTNRRRGRLLTFLPCDVDRIRLGDANEHDLRYAEEVRLFTPYVDPKTDKTEIATLVLTLAAAYIERSNGEKIGVFADDLTHPFPYLPVIGVRLEEPTVDGAWLPSLPGDLYAIQIGLTVALSDAEDQIRELSPGLQVLSGLGAAKVASEIKRDQHRILIIPTELGSEDAIAEYTHHTTTPQTDQYLRVADKILSLLASYRYVSPTGLRGDSADAKEVERDDQYVDRLAQEGGWREVEDALSELIVLWHNSIDPLQIVSVSPAVTYRYPQPPRNDLQSAQARAIGYAMGNRNPADDVETGGQDLTDEQRLERVARNIGQYLMWRGLLGDHVPAGFDSIAKFIGLGQKQDPADEPDTGDQAAA